MKYFIFLFFIVLPPVLFAQPSIQWSKCYGGTKSDLPGGMIQTRDGGYIIAGQTTSSDKDVTFNHGDYDLWVVKLSAGGAIEWQKTYGGSREDDAGAILQTIDGGYIIEASTYSDDGDLAGIGHHGSLDSADIWVLRIDTIGNILWQKTFGGSGNDLAAGILDGGEGEYVIMGETNSTDGDVKGFHGGKGFDIWLLKITQTGTIVWQKTFGGTKYDYGNSLIPTRDGGFAIVGNTNSTDGDVKEKLHDTVFGDLWVLKLNGGGDILWQKTYGGSGYDVGYSIIETLDHGYAIAGQTSSNDGDVSGLHFVGKLYYDDAWILKLDSTGIVQWSKCYGGTQGDAAYSIYQTSDSSYVIGASTASSDGDVTGYQGGTDCWIFKTSKSGKLLWERTLGGTWADASSGAGIMPAADSGFLVVTMTQSVNGDVTGRKGDTTDSDIWLVHLYPEKAGVPMNLVVSENISLYPNPASGKTKISYTLDKSSQVKIEIFNPLGEKLRTILDAKQEVGNYEQEFDLLRLASGAYFFKIEFDGKIEMRELEIVR
jgi:hypothetical protein